MKHATTKGNITSLKENEIMYLKTLLKSKAEKWEDISALTDIYRHCKFTIRMLTRQMACIDNKKIFRKNRSYNKESTKFMVYRVETLYSAKSEASKIFKFIAKLIYDETEFLAIEKKPQ